jgi:hypothetical protein
MRNVVETIEFMIMDYYQENNKKPAGLILGPTEYVNLCEIVKRNAPHLKDARVNGLLITEYRGFPVFVKEMPGVDIMIGYEEALRYLP